MKYDFLISEIFECVFNKTQTKFEYREIKNNIIFFTVYEHCDTDLTTVSLSNYSFNIKKFKFEAYFEDKGIDLINNRLLIYKRKNKLKTLK